MTQQTSAASKYQLLMFYYFKGHALEYNLAYVASTTVDERRWPAAPFDFEDGDTAWALGWWWRWSSSCNRFVQRFRTPEPTIEHDWWDR